jgi:hypothetical protein
LERPVRAMKRDAVARSEMNFCMLSEDPADADSVLQLARKANGVAPRIKEISVFGGLPLA